MYKHHLLSDIAVFSILICFLSLSDHSEAKSLEKTHELKNNSDALIKNYLLEIPVNKLGPLPFGSYIALVKGKIVPVEISGNIKGQEAAIIPIDELLPGETLKLGIKQGSAKTYPKRTYAELSHKVGGRFEGKKYTGDSCSWIRLNAMTTPGTFEDHSYFIKYEGPGWENDKVAFRLYFDNRNAIDVFGKTLSDIVLPYVGTDGFGSYHKPAFWGMDNLKVGKALGLGTIAYWDGEKATRIEKKDSTRCTINEDGKLRCQVEMKYYGWKIEGKECDLTSLVSLDAGSRASHMEIEIKGNLDDIATGITKNKGVKYYSGKDSDKGEWSYIATFGQQSEDDRMQGLAVFFRKKQLIKLTEDKFNYLVVLKPQDKYADYYFMPTWEGDKDPVKTEDEFKNCIREVLDRLNNKDKINFK